MHGPQGDEKKQQDERLAHFNQHCAVKIMVLGGKGGVGKSTIAVNLAVGLAQMGFRVGILDADLHGPNTARMLGLEGARLEAGSQEGLIAPVQARPLLRLASLALTHEDDTAFIWRGPLKIAIIRQFLADTEWGPLDFLVADSPPGTGDEPLTLAQSLSGHRLGLVVTTPQEVALQDASRSLRFVQSLRLPLLGIVENMSGYLGANGEILPLFGGPGAEALARAHHTTVLAHLPLDPEVGNNPQTPFMERTSFLKEKFQPVVEAAIRAFKQPPQQPFSLKRES